MSGLLYVLMAVREPVPSLCDGAEFCLSRWSRHRRCSSSAQNTICFYRQQVSRPTPKSDTRHQSQS